ncbi:MAG: general stress protein [Limnochordia bacterium]|jgi:outer membrane lipoprotein SlyB
METLIGTFSSRDQAEDALEALRDEGFDESEVSIVAKDESGQGGDDMAGEDMADGTAWGGALGGMAGLLASAGALAIPGIGPIIAAGPLAATLSGAVAGGVAGGLIDLGIPEERGRYYEEEVKRGKILAVVESDDEDRLESAADILREFGANDVESH